MKTKEPKLKYRLSDHAGAGCAMCPPDHPRYYVRSVYTVGGNSFNYENAPQYFLEGKGWFTELEDVDKFFKPLPLEHPRTRAWIKHLYSHMAHCYADETRQEYGRPATLVFPPNEFELIHAGLFKINREDSDFKNCVTDQCFNVSHRKREEERKAKMEEWRKIAVPENHLAVRAIREYYPDYQPEIELIENPPKLRGNWYERAQTRPDADKCPGDISVRLPHNARGWCQYCGRDSSVVPAARQ
jgi:hypothetical protein